MCNSQHICVVTNLLCLFFIHLITSAILSWLIGWQDGFSKKIKIDSRTNALKYYNTIISVAIYIPFF